MVKTTTKIKGSSEQEAIWKFLLEEDDHLVVNSVAGSGKTLTGVEYCKREWRGQIAYVAFNKHNQVELKEKLRPYKNVKAMTYHGLGRAALLTAFPRAEIDQYKLDTILDSYYANVSSLSLKGYLTVRTRKLVSLAKQYQAEDRYALEYIADHHAIEMMGIEEQVYDAVGKILQICKTNTASIDFDDMVWLPKQLGIRMPQYDVMLIDEAQDTNLSQQWLALESAERLVVIGDRNQAIYGFRGADVMSIDNMKSALSKTKRGVKEMSLSVTRRCAKSHVELAQRVVPQIKAMKTAPEGIIREVDTRVAVKEMRPGDMVLCRVSADLLSIAYSLIKRNIKAVVRGKDIGEGVVKLVDRAEKKCHSNNIKDILKAACELTSQEVMKYNSLPNDRGANRAMNAQDKYECLVHLTEDAKTAQEVKARVEHIFADFEDDGKPKQAVVLGTVHRTKGLEANRVFVLRPELIPHPMAKKEWEHQQESNLAYVSVTRAVYNSNSPGELIWVGPAPTMFQKKQRSLYEKS